MFWVGLALLIGGCPAPRGGGIDSGVVTPGQPPRDAGRDGSVVHLDAGMVWSNDFAGEPCPDEAFGGTDGLPDGSVEFGLCVALQTLSGQALLNGVAAPGPVKIRFIGGNWGAEIDRPIDSLGAYTTQVLRGRYDILQYQPSGVFATHLGFKDLGPIDMRADQKRDFATVTHAIRGTAQFGSAPFVGTNAPNDIYLTAYGTPQVQTVSAMSAYGAFEVRLMEGTFALLLDSPAKALSGTELIAYRLTPGAVTLDRDLPLEINVPTRLVEGEITIDGRPFPDRRNGPDFNLEFVQPGEGQPSVRTRHSGGVASYSGLVPQGKYAVTLNFERQPDRSLPASVFNQQVAAQLDLTRGDARLSANFVSWEVEGGILIDGRPIRPNPTYTWKMYMYGFAGATNTQSGLIYEVPMEASSFLLRIFNGNYFTVLGIDENFADDLAEGFYIVDRYLQVNSNRSLPINIETSVLTGTLLVDGVAPPAGQVAGQLWFRNRALEGQNSWFRKRVVTSEDGEFRARLPKGEYEVYFLIDRNTYPEHATGRQLLVSRLILDEPVSATLTYDTTLVTGPIRLSQQVVPDSVPGEEVGVVLRSEDGRVFAWGFSGGAANYRLRVPKGEYALDFVINQNALEGIAWGTAPFGKRMSAVRADDGVDTGR